MTKPPRCLTLLLLIGCGATAAEPDDASLLGAEAEAAGLRLRIDTPAQTVVGGECSTVVKVQRQTATGIDYTGPAIAVQLSGDGFSFFDDPACANPASVLWISIGTHTNPYALFRDDAGHVDRA